jgi:hypothetical protein
MKGSSHQARSGQRIYSNSAAVNQAYFVSLVRGPYVPFVRLRLSLRENKR